MSYLNTKKKVYTFVFVTLTALLVPGFVFAAASNIQGLVRIVGGIFASLGPILVGLALLYFFWGISQFILHAGDEAKRSEGRQIMVWGIIALFVIVSVWGLVAVLNNTFVRRGITPTAPGLPGISGGSGIFGGLGGLLDNLGI